MGQESGKRQRKDLEQQMRDIPSRTETTRTVAQLNAGSRKHWLKLVQLDDCQGKLILDAGCGLGQYGRILAGKGNQVIGIDIAPGLIDTTHRLACEEGLPFCPVLGDLENLPFKQGVFDICVVVAVLHHFPQIDRPLEELAASLKPTGIIALLDPNGGNWLQRWARPLGKWAFGRYLQRIGCGTDNVIVHSPERYADVLRRVGFTDLKVFYYSFPPTSSEERQVIKEWGDALNPLFRPFWLLFLVVTWVSDKVLPPRFGASTVTIVAKRGNA